MKVRGGLLALGLVLGLAAKAAAPVAAQCVYSDDGSVIDLMVVYTSEAAADNSAGNIQTYIQANVDLMNRALANSLVIPRIRIVHTQQLTYDDPNDNIWSLHRLLDPADGVLDEVHAWRDTYRADLVLMIGKCVNCGGTAACNEGDQYIFTPSGGFAIISHDWPVQDAIGMAHELAHTMGCGHNRAAENGGPGLPINCRYYSYSYGYDFQGLSGQWYSDIMSYGPTRCGGTLSGSPCVLYNNNCPSGSPCGHVPVCAPSDPCVGGSRKILHFSNPNVLYDGIPTGVPAGQANAADNALTLNNNAFTVANWRTSGENVWVHFAYVGVEQGCFERPYNTPLEGIAAVPSSGSVIFKPGTFPGAVTIQSGTKSFKLKAWGGVARIGG